MSIREGIMARTDDPRPPKSPEGFEWPTRPIDPAIKVKFRTALIEQLRARGMEQKDLAVALYGAEILPTGTLRPMRNDSHKLISGKSFPTEPIAKYVAAVLKIPLSDLLSPKGKLVPMEPGKRAAPTAKAKRAYARKGSNGNGNGHGDGAMHDDADMAIPIPLPEGTTPAVVTFETIASDPRFAKVSVSGTMTVEAAMSVIALIHRHG